MFAETLFSTAAMGNPNCNFMPTNMLSLPYSTNATPVIPKEEGGLMMMMMQNDGEEMESVVSGSELQIDHQEQSPENAQDGVSDDQQQQLHKKKRYHRHSDRQIQEMEAVFKECQHPDDKQRLRLSQELGLKPRQVKFWFQNRRTQMKAQQDRSDNVILRAENENLKSDNYRLQAELLNLVCPNCGGPATVGAIAFEELRLENARLREEFQRVCCIASRYSGGVIQSILPTQLPSVSSSLDLDINMLSRQFPADSFAPCGEIQTLAMLPATSPPPDSSSLVLTEEEKSLAVNLAILAMNELTKMSIASEPLWINETGKERLNEEEYRRMFQWPLTCKDNSNGPIITEATRATAVVIMNSINLVDAFLDVNKWMELFPTIVARAKTIQVVKSGVSGASGSLHLMYAEFQILSPLVPTREAFFMRFCQQNVEEGTWAIVDFPLDGFHVNIPSSSFPLYRRRPSGCVIQDMPNGYSRVAWIEHVEVDEKPVHQIFGEYVHSGMAFGARRWLSILQRECERAASLMARNISDLGVIPSPEARKSIMRLAHRMVKTFSVNISTSNGLAWTALSDSSNDNVRISTRKVSEPGQPNGVILCAVSTTWLPYPHYQIFDHLRDGYLRSQLDVLSNGNTLHEVAHIANGSHPGNCISLLRVNVASNSSHHVELMLQETCTDQSGSLVVYTTIDVDSIQLAMSGQDPSCIPLLPLGFVIVPVEPSSSTDQHKDPNSINKDGGSLLTVGLQVIASPVSSTKLNLSSVTALNNHLCTTAHQISAALCASTTKSCPDDIQNLESATAALEH